MAELRDLFGRRIHYLRAAVTDRCDFRCRYCMPQDNDWLPAADRLSDGELVRLIRIFAGLGVDKVRITGGEPLLREGIIGLLHRVTAIEGIAEVNITTNGNLLEEYALSMKKAGVNRINVSLDTLNRGLFASLTGRDVLPRVLKGINRALDAGFSTIKINMVVMKGVNSGELADFARLTLEYPFQVRFIEYMPFKPGQDYLMTAADMMKQLTAAGITGLTPVPGQLSTARIYRLPGAQGSIGFISPVSRHFCAACNRVRLTPDGFLRPCLLTNREYPLREWLRSGMNEPELAGRIAGIVRAKPRRSQLDANYSSDRPMPRIGG